MSNYDANLILIRDFARRVEGGGGYSSNEPAELCQALGISSEQINNSLETLVRAYVAAEPWVGFEPRRVLWWLYQLGVPDCQPTRHPWVARIEWLEARVRELEGEK